MRCSDIRMGLAAVTVFLPVVMTAAYGVTKGNDNAQGEATTIAAVRIPIVAAAARPMLNEAPVMLAAAPEMATPTPALAIASDAAPASRGTRTKHQHPAKIHHSHRAG